MSSPFDLARETFKTLATSKTPPTPDNYAKTYARISGTRTEDNNGAERVLRKLASALLATPKTSSTGMALNRALNEEDWAQCQSSLEQVLPLESQDEKDANWSGLIRNLLRQLDTTHRGLTIARKKESVETVLARFGSNADTLHEKLEGLIRSWSAVGGSAPPPSMGIEQAPTAASAAPSVAAVAATPTSSTVVPESAAPVSVASGAAPADSDAIAELAGLLAQTLETFQTALPELAQEITQLCQHARGVRSTTQFPELTQKLRQFWIRAELRGGDKAKIHDGLVRLLRLLVQNIGEMTEDEDWLHGQITILKEIVARPLDKHNIADAERGLRDAIIKQGLLKQSLSEAKSTLKNLMTSFVDRLGSITESTGDYHQKIAAYSQKISRTDNLTDLSHLLNDIMQDTRVIQTSALRSHEELTTTRKKVEEAETRIQQLEQELAEVSEKVREDQLTGALNRRGMNEAFERESTRAERTQHPLCVALLDLDNFKRLNDTKGHQAGDEALIHLSHVIKDALRPSDSVARYGGEEFVILLPDISIQEAAHTVERLQRELTKRFFLHGNERILITFSAGVAQRHPDESLEDLLGRADKAMYQAKMDGKNRVVVATESSAAHGA